MQARGREKKRESKNNWQDFIFLPIVFHFALRSVNKNPTVIIASSSSFPSPFCFASCTFFRGLPSLDTQNREFASNHVTNSLCGVFAFQVLILFKLLLLEKKVGQLPWTCQVWKWNVLSEQRYTYAKLRKFTAVVWWGESLYPHHTNFSKILRLWGAISLLVLNKSISNLAILLI